MTEPRTDAAPRLYSPWGATLAAATGGVFPGMLLAGLNFRAWGEERRARRAIRIGIVGTLVMVVIAMIIPYDVPWGRPVYQSVQVAFVVGYFLRVQRDRIAAHRASGGGMKSIWRAVWIGVGCGLAFTALIFLLWFVIGELT